VDFEIDHASLAKSRTPTAQALSRNPARVRPSKAAAKHG